MIDLLRQEIASSSQRIVVKVGTRVLTTAAGTLDSHRTRCLAEQLHQLTDAGHQVVLVSSGAVGAGMSHLGWTKRPTDLAKLQAVAAIGQAKLIEEYDRHLSAHNRHAAQVLLTADDFGDRARYLNTRNTLLALIELGAIPIVNENDTVAVEELMTVFGDNDRLASLVTNLLGAKLLVILSDVAGLYDRAPDLPDARLIPTVTDFDEELRSFVHDGPQQLSKGGMASKLEAARMTTAAGANVIIASGRDDAVLKKILNGDLVGTLFLAQGKTISPWKRWLAFSSHPTGKLMLDSGACQAVARDGSSLLAIGISAYSGQFHKGDVVSICDVNSQEIARGLTNYSSGEIAQIAGQKSDQIAALLGHCPYQEVVHRDNMAVTRTIPS